MVTLKEMLTLPPPPGRVPISTPTVGSVLDVTVTPGLAWTEPATRVVLLSTVSVNHTPVAAPLPLLTMVIW